MVVMERDASVLASAVEKRVAASSHTQSTGRNRMPTFNRILLCYDGTREGQHALKDGASLAQELHADVHVLSVLNHSAWMQGADITAAVPIELITESARSLLDEGLKKLAARGLLATGHFAVGDPLDQIPIFADELKVDLIVVGHRHSSRLARWWGGRSDGLLLDRVSCSVLVTMGPETGVETTADGETTRPVEDL
jgi:nucleotide-binding universal stress UspA family protein